MEHLYEKALESAEYIKMRTTTSVKESAQKIFAS